MGRRINRLSIKETPNTATTTRGMVLNIFPIMPGMNMMGIKVTILVITEKNTGTAMLFAPWMEASRNPMP